MNETRYFKNAHVDINFYNGNCDAYEHVKELTFMEDGVKIVAENEDGNLYADYYDRYIISLIRVAIYPKEEYKKALPHTCMWCKHWERDTVYDYNGQGHLCLMVEQVTKPDFYCAYYEDVRKVDKDE